MCSKYKFAKRCKTSTRSPNTQPADLTLSYISMVEVISINFSIKDIELQEFTMPEDDSYEYPEMDEGKWHFKSSFTFHPLAATEILLKTHLTYYLYLKEDPLQTPIIYISIITSFA